MPPDVTPETGLSAAEVRDRVERGLTNEARERTSRTYGEIIRANVFTRFNAILGTMLVVILAVGEIQDATFGGIVIANALIGIIQEIRAKKKLDSLAVAIAPRIHVVRDGEVEDIEVYVPLAGLIDYKKEQERLSRDLASKKKDLETVQLQRAGEGEDTRATARELFHALTQNSVLVCRRGIGGSEAD